MHLSGQYAIIEEKADGGRIMRKPFIAANWKMHKNIAESVDFVNQINDKLPDPGKV